MSVQNLDKSSWSDLELFQEAAMDAEMQFLRRPETLADTDLNKLILTLQSYGNSLQKQNKETASDLLIKSHPKNLDVFEPHSQVIPPFISHKQLQQRYNILKHHIRSTQLLRKALSDANPQSTNNNLQEAPYTCSVCYWSDYDGLNHVVYCDTCGLGAHQVCHQIEDLDQEFYCNKCSFYQRQI